MRTPRIVYGATTINLTMPALPWDYETERVGGTAVSDAGVPASFVRRTDHRVVVTLRVLESERVAVETWLDAVRNDTATTFRFDADDAATAITVYVDSPRVGEVRRMTRDPQYPGAFQVPVVFRTTAGTRPHVAFWG